MLDAGRGRAEALAVLGFLGYALYLAASAVALYLLNRPASAPHRPAPAVPAPIIDDADSPANPAQNLSRSTIR